MTLSNTNVVASRLIKREKALLSVAVRRSKTPLNFVCGNESVTHSDQSKFSWRNGIFFGIFRIEYLSIRSEKVDGHFANCRFSFRDLFIFISFCFISLCKLL